MATRGELALDDPLTQHLAVVGVADIQLVHLATHTSGLPFLPADFAPKDPSEPHAVYGEADVVRAVARPRARAAGEAFEYSNLGAGVLALALAKRAGMPYELLLEEGVAKPLGLVDTAVRLNPGQARRFAEGHDADGNPVVPWTFDALSGAGGIRSSTRDLAKFLQAHLKRPASSLGIALRVTGKRRIQISAQEGSIGLAWHITPDGTVRWHNGETGGFHAYLAFDSNRHHGVVVLANTATPIVDRLGAALLGSLRGEPFRFEMPRTIRHSTFRVTACGIRRDLFFCARSRLDDPSRRRPVICAHYGAG